MSIETLIPVSEYLEGSYSPDCHYVEGRLVERNVGEIEHSWTQRSLIEYVAKYRKVGLHAWPEQRIQINADHYRVADVCVTEGIPAGPIITVAPLVCIEILSRKDSLREVQQVIDDYVSIGVRYCWIIDPLTRTCYVASAAGFQKLEDRIFRTSSPHPELIIPVDELYKL